MYGAAGPQTGEAGRPAVPAATVVLLRDTGGGPQVLMLRKNSRIAFGGMWVFLADVSIRTTIRKRVIRNRTITGTPVRETPRAREAREEAGLDLDASEFVWFSHWTPPPDVPARFATWFFAAPGREQAISVDGGEIEAHRWIRPADALARHKAGEIDLVAPTWVTLYQMAQHATASALLGRLRANPARFYVTRIARSSDNVRVAMWREDAGYDDWNLEAEGARHRLWMPADGFTFEHDAVEY